MRPSPRQRPQQPSLHLLPTGPHNRQRSATSATATTTEPAASTTTSPPPTTAAATAAEIASAQIEATLDAFNTAIYDCYNTPEACNVDAVLDTYYAPGDDVTRPVFKDVWKKPVDNNQIKISDGLIDRTTIRITTNDEGTVGTSFHCEVDRTFNIPKDTPPTASTTYPPDLTPDYLRFYYEWTRQPDDTWKIIRSEFSGGRSPGAVDVGALATPAERVVAQCD